MFVLGCVLWNGFILFVQVLALLTEQDRHASIVSDSFGIVPALSNAMQSSARFDTGSHESFLFVLCNRIAL